MIVGLGLIWLLAAAGLALLNTLLAVGIGMDSLHCVVKGDEMCLHDPAILASYPQASLGAALAGVRPVDLGIMMACLMPPALLTVVQRGAGQWAPVLATVGLAAVIAWHMLREFGGACDIPIEVNRIQYLFPSVIVTLLAYRFAKRR